MDTKLQKIVREIIEWDGMDWSMHYDSKCKQCNENEKEMVRKFTKLDKSLTKLRKEVFG